MEQINPTLLPNQLINEIFSLTKKNNDTIKNGGKFSEAKEIRKKVKELTEELKKILVQNEN
jgi:hypothetical protein